MSGFKPKISTSQIEDLIKIPYALNEFKKWLESTIECLDPTALQPIINKIIMEYRKGEGSD